MERRPSPRERKYRSGYDVSGVEWSGERTIADVMCVFISSQKATYIKHYSIPLLIPSLNHIWGSLSKASTYWVSETTEIEPHLLSSPPRRKVYIKRSVESIICSEPGRLLFVSPKWKDYQIWLVDALLARIRPSSYKTESNLAHGLRGFRTADFSQVHQPQPYVCHAWGQLVDIKPPPGPALLNH
jgi:hypothetical protein